MKLKDMRWDRIMADLLKLFFPIPFLLMSIGTFLIYYMSVFSEANELGIVPEVTNNTIFIFVVMELGLNCALMGIVYLQLNCMSTPKKEDSYYLKERREQP